MGKEKKTVLTSALNEVKTTLSALRGEIGAIDVRLQQISGEVEALQDAPVSFEDWAGFLRAHVERQGARFVTELLSTRLMSPADMYRTAPFNKRPWSTFEAGENPLPNDMSPMLVRAESSMFAMCAMFPEQICEAIVSKVKDRIGDKWGNEDEMPVPERRALVNDLLRERESLAARRSALQAEVDGLVRELA